jgi:hypothetical protein
VKRFVGKLRGPRSREAAGIIVTTWNCLRKFLTMVAPQSADDPARFSLLRTAQLNPPKLAITLELKYF